VWLAVKDPWKIQKRNARFETLSLPPEHDLFWRASIFNHHIIASMLILTYYLTVLGVMQLL